MLYNGSNITSDLFKGTTRVNFVYLGDVKLYPGLVSTASGITSTGWYYYLPNRSRTITPYTEYTYQNNTTSRVYGTAEFQLETANVSYIDPGSWNYFANNSYRSKFVTPVYTFSSDNTVMYGEDIETVEYGTDISEWQYNQHVRTKSVIYQYSDTQKAGPNLYEEATITYELYNWNYENLPIYRKRNAVPIYEFSLYEPHVLRDGDMFEIQDYVTNSSTSWEYDYVNDKRTGITTYNFESGAQHQVSGIVQYPTNIVTVDIGEYDNGACDYQTYEYVDYLQQRDVYYWPSAPTPTSTDWFNGPERRQKIEGQCGWVKAWTDWVNNGQYCGSTGALGYSCDGEYTVVYNRQARYYQFPDGTGRTGTEYRAGSEYSREQVHGQCGYINPNLRSEIEYFGYDAYSTQTAYSSSITGSLWYDNTDNNYYTTAEGSTVAANGHYLVEDTGDWTTSDYIYINN